MSTFEVDTNKLYIHQKTEQNAVRNLRNISNGILNCKNELDHVAAMGNYRLTTNLQWIKSRLDQEINKVDQLQSALGNIAGLYANAEKNASVYNVTNFGNSGSSNGVKKIDFSGIIKQVTGWDKSMKATEYKPFFNLKDLAGRMKSVGGITKDDWLTRGGTWLDFLLSAVGLATMDPSSKASEVYKTLLSTMGKGVDSFKSLLNKDKHGAEIEELTIIKNTLGTISALVGCEGKSVSDVLLNSKDLINAGNTWGQYLWEKGYIDATTEMMQSFSKEALDAKTIDSIKGSASEIVDRLKGDANATCATFAIGTSAIGQCLKARESLGKDGKERYEWKDLSDVYLTAGLSGVSSLVSGYSRGLVKVDTNEAKKTIEKNVKIAQDMIDVEGWGTGAVVATGLLSSVAVTYVSTMEIAWDSLNNSNKGIGPFGIGFILDTNPANAATMLAGYASDKIKNIYKEKHMDSGGGGR